MSLSKRGNRKALVGICEFHKSYFILCNQEPITRSEQFFMCSCHGVFTDQFIFRTILARIKNIFDFPQTSHQN